MSNILIYSIFLIISFGFTLSFLLTSTFLLNDEKTRNQMGLAGRKFVEDNFSWNIIVKKFVNDIHRELNL